MSRSDKRLILSAASLWGRVFYVPGGIYEVVAVIGAVGHVPRFGDGVADWISESRSGVGCGECDVVVGG